MSDPDRAKLFGGSLGVIGGGINYVVLGGKAHNFSSDVIGWSIGLSKESFRAGLGASTGTIIGVSGVVKYSIEECDDCDK